MDSDLIANPSTCEPKHIVLRRRFETAASRKFQPSLRYAVQNHKCWVKVLDFRNVQKCCSCQTKQKRERNLDTNNAVFGNDWWIDFCIVAFCLHRFVDGLDAQFSKIWCTSLWNLHAHFLNLTKHTIFPDANSGIVSTIIMKPSSITTHAVSIVFGVRVPDILRRGSDACDGHN